MSDTYLSAAGRSLRMRAFCCILAAAIAVSLLQVTPVMAATSDPSPCDRYDISLAPELPPYVTFTGEETPEATQATFYRYVWQSFVALNWPNVPIELREREIVEGYRGQPDRTASILDQKGSGPMPIGVWEAYRNPESEVFLEPAAWDDYPVWNSVQTQLDALPGIRPLKDYSGIVDYAPDINQPYFFPDETGPLVDRNGNFVRYEVGVNEAFFTYIKHFRYYDASRQIADVATSLAHPETLYEPDPSLGFQRPPHGDEPYLASLPDFAKQGTVDVKAAWRVLDSKTDNPERYLHRTIVVDADGTEQDMGLVALHILRYTLVKKPDPDSPTGYAIAPGYVASTFEQVDNVEVTAATAEQGITPSFNTGAPPSAVQREFGFDYAIPHLARSQNPEPQPPRSIYRVTPLPEGVKAINACYQQRLAPSVFQYYQLIGTQNKRPDFPLEFTPDGRVLNGYQGPTTGVYTNTSNLINAALESYTQKNFSCIGCHVRARPQGVPDQAWEEDHFRILTFLLQGAKSRP